MTLLIDDASNIFRHKSAVSDLFLQGNFLQPKFTIWSFHSIKFAIKFHGRSLFTHYKFHDEGPSHFEGLVKVLQVMSAFNWFSGKSMFKIQSFRQHSVTITQ